MVETVTPPAVFCNLIKRVPIFESNVKINPKILFCCKTTPSITVNDHRWPNEINLQTRVVIINGPDQPGLNVEFSFVSTRNHLINGVHVVKGENN